MDTKKLIGVRVWNTRNNTMGTIRYIEDAYVAITRAKYSVGFVYKTIFRLKILESNGHLI